MEEAQTRVDYQDLTSKESSRSMDRKTEMHSTNQIMFETKIMESIVRILT